MATKIWETVKVQYCQHARQEVRLEAEVIYPAESLPDQPARIVSHRCSNGMECNQVEKSSCTWSGTNPGFDPYR